MPSLSAKIIPRQRVTLALEEALAAHSLVVLTAPLGHGKSAAAEQLLAGWKARHFYLRMKPGWQDNADYLWLDACSRLEEQGLPAGDLQLIGYPGDNARLYRCLSFFRDYLSKEPTLLVLDDFHLADASPFSRLVENLICEEIPGFSLLILSRTKPELPLAYLQMKGQAAVLDSTLLDFTREETRQLFDAAGEPDSELADIALGFSHGWAAALRISLKSYQADKVIKPLKNIEELLADFFFATYSASDQCLLLQLAVLESFSLEQAGLLSGEKDAAPPRLRKLYEQNAFIQYSPATDSYSIHALLRSFLLKKLGENMDSACNIFDVQLLYRRAAEISLQARNYLQALQLFAQAGRAEDLLRILQMFEVPGEGFFMVPALEAVTQIIRDIPWEIRLMSPIGYLGFVHRHAVRVSRAEAGEMAREAERRFLEPGVLPEETQRKLRGEFELIRAILSFNNIEEICRCYERADELLQIRPSAGKPFQASLSANRLLPGRSSLVNKNMYWTYN